MSADTCLICSHPLPPGAGELLTASTRICRYCAAGVEQLARRSQQAWVVEARGRHKRRRAAAEQAWPTSQDNDRISSGKRAWVGKTWKRR